MDGVRADAKSMINFFMAQICRVQDDDLLTVRYNIIVQTLGRDAQNRGGDTQVVWLYRKPF